MAVASMRAKDGDRPGPETVMSTLVSCAVASVSLFSSFVLSTAWSSCDASGVCRSSTTPRSTASTLLTEICDGVTGVSVSLLARSRSSLSDSVHSHRLFFFTSRRPDIECWRRRRPLLSISGLRYLSFMGAVTQPSASATSDVLSVEGMAMSCSAGSSFSAPVFACSSSEQLRSMSLAI